MNSKQILHVIVILFIPFFLNAQSDLKIKRKDFKTGSDVGFTEAWRNLLEGDIHFEGGKGTYYLAREYYLQAHQYNSEHPVLNYKLGLCYLYTDDKYEALNYIRKAYDQAPKLSHEMHYHMGRAYHLVLEFDKAIEHYREYKNVLTRDELTNQTEHIDKLIVECIDGKKIIEAPKRVIITNLGTTINSPYDDYFPILTANDSVMFFTSRRPLSEKSKRNPYDNKFYENVYYSRFVEGDWQQAVTLERFSRKKKNDAALGISPSGNELYIYRGKKNGGDIYMSTFKKGEWSSPKRLSSKINSKEFEGAVHISPGNDSLFFISASNELTLGGKDILFTKRNSKGKWNKPSNLGSLVNTRYDESGVYITPDGMNLYLSSKGHNTMGGYDIFHSVKRQDGTWTDPQNLGYPINTPDDDLFFSFSSDGKSGYYSTIREGGLGASDIYRVVFLGTEKELMLSTEDIMIAGVLDLSKKGFFALPVTAEIDSSFYLTGRVLNKKTLEPVSAKLEFIDVDASMVMATTMTSDSGTFNVKFSQPKVYGVEINARDYLFYLDKVDISAASPDEPVLHDFFLEKIEVGTKVVLENIYFETNKATLTAASYTQLNQVVELLKSNPTIRLEISGHTDNVGSLKVNTKLSEDRAKAVVDYLITNGIIPSRLESKGYAFSQPVAPNDTPEGRERNRRVEFKVLEI